ncbi:MAG: AEC family transporter [Clostridia bacterium]|nr:AEC family transporter [Clostridia bacterium]
MENLVLSFTVVLPLFIMMVLGYFLKFIKIFDKHTLDKLNSSIFKVFLPILIFYNVYTSEISDVFNPKLIGFSAAAILGVFFLCLIIIPVIEKDNRKRGVLIQGIYRSNFVIFGIPLSVSLYNEQIQGTTAVLIAVIIPLFNFLAVVSLEIFRGGKPNFLNILKGIITNPLIISSAIGFLFLFSKIKLPDVIVSTVKDISKIATPLALIALGGSIDFTKIKGNIRQLIIGISGKLIFTPILILTTGILLGFRNAELAILLSLSASPVAVSSYTMAQQMGGDDDLAAQLLMFGTAVCIFTVFLWIFILKQLGYM